MSETRARYSAPNDARMTLLEAVVTLRAYSESFGRRDMNDRERPDLRGAAAVVLRRLDRLEALIELFKQFERIT